MERKSQLKQTERASRHFRVNYDRFLANEEGFFPHRQRTSSNNQYSGIYDRNPVRISDDDSSREVPNILVEKHRKLSIKTSRWRHCLLSKMSNAVGLARRGSCSLLPRSPTQAVWTSRGLTLNSQHLSAFGFDDCKSSCTIREVCISLGSSHHVIRRLRDFVRLTSFCHPGGCGHWTT